MSHASVAAELSMDEILEKIQRTIATDGKEGSQLADSTRPTTEEMSRSDMGQAEPPREQFAAISEPQASILSPATASAAVSAFVQLAAIHRHRHRMAEFPMGGEARTLEDVVRGLLTPMMRDWLDQKLPEILERLVKAELARALGEVHGA
jgi:cell pole-organizing protein PopZ